MAEGISDSTFSEIEQEVLADSEFKDTIIEHQLSDEVSRHLAENRQNVLKSIESINLEYASVKDRLDSASIEADQKLGGIVANLDPELPPPAVGCMVIIFLAVVAAIAGGAIGLAEGSAKIIAPIVVFLGVVAGFIWYWLLKMRARAIEVARNVVGIPILQQQRDELQKKSIEALRNAIQESLREFLSNTLNSDKDYSFQLRRLRAQGLAEGAEAKLFIPTATKNKLNSRIDQMSRGTIGAYPVVPG